MHDSGREHTRATIWCSRLFLLHPDTLLHCDMSSASSSNYPPAGSRAVMQEIESSSKPTDIQAGSSHDRRYARLLAGPDENREQNHHMEIGALPS